MKRFSWFLLGGLACVLVPFFLAGDRRRIEIAIGPEGGAPEDSEVIETSWGVELRLVHKQRAPFELEEPHSMETLAKRLDDLGTGTDRLFAPRETAKYAVRPNPPPPDPKWTQSPELAEHYGNGQLHFRVSQIRNETGKWVREGAWEAWHENGELHEQGAYLNGREQGKWTWWYDTGVRMAQGKFVDGKRTGPWTFWHGNGNLMMEGQYRDGDGEGRWIHYDESGAQKARVDFVGGVGAEVPL